MLEKHFSKKVILREQRKKELEEKNWNWLQNIPSFLRKLWLTLEINALPGVLEYNETGQEIYLMKNISKEKDVFSNIGSQYKHLPKQFARFHFFKEDLYDKLVFFNPSFQKNRPDLLVIFKKKNRHAMRRPRGKQKQVQDEEKVDSIELTKRQKENDKGNITLNFHVKEEEEEINQQECQENNDNAYMTQKENCRLNPEIAQNKNEAEIAKIVQERDNIQSSFNKLITAHLMLLNTIQNMKIQVPLSFP